MLLDQGQLMFRARVDECIVNSGRWTPRRKLVVGLDLLSYVQDAQPSYKVVARRGSGSATPPAG
jgi:hypothetical protein